MEFLASRIYLFYLFAFGTVLAGLGRDSETRVEVGEAKNPNIWFLV